MPQQRQQLPDLINALHRIHRQLAINFLPLPFRIGAISGLLARVEFVVNVRFEFRPVGFLDLARLHQLDAPRANATLRRTTSRTVSALLTTQTCNGGLSGTPQPAQVL